jgi:hypothetical protein
VDASKILFLLVQQDFGREMYGINKIFFGKSETVCFVKRQKTAFFFRKKRTYIEGWHSRNRLFRHRGKSGEPLSAYISLSHWNCCHFVCLK